MSDSLTYWEDQDFPAKEIKTEEYSKDVVNIAELFKLLSTEDRIAVKRLIASEKVF